MGIRTSSIRKQSLASRWDAVMVMWLLGPISEDGPNPRNRGKVIAGAVRNIGYFAVDFGVRFAVVAAGLSDLPYDGSLNGVFWIDLRS
ncbi:hypothetical protein AVEN_194548-1 [Araneus ventricosus]|uniref:Uncharacterized protein n=1 Tax=Araneus ventricosus TaxID=182803 RepID=A0A4Y2A654_ARAVE|nr:hypothetical protein AVEN_194548-1 [Araneus ventricosus]